MAHKTDIEHLADQHGWKVEDSVYWEKGKYEDGCRLLFGVPGDGHEDIWLVINPAKKRIEDLWVKRLFTFPVRVSVSFADWVKIQKELHGVLTVNREHGTKRQLHTKRAG